MKKSLLLLALTIGFISCGGKDQSHQIPFITGYWEIKSVEMPDGTLKEFTVSTSIDYITVQADSGVRKKLMPRLDGTFREFPTSEKFKFVQQNDSLYMFYETPFANWKEAVIKADEQEFVVKNNNGIYAYKRFKNLDLKTE